jgi:hypothetical protein
VRIVKFYYLILLLDPNNRLFVEDYRSCSSSLCSSSLLRPKSFLSTILYSHYVRGQVSHPIKNVTCYNQMIVAIVDVLTSFIFIFTNDNR